MGHLTIKYVNYILWMRWLTLHVKISHIIRAIYKYSYEKVEVTGPQMVLTMKLTTFAWNVYDGRRKTEVRAFTFSPMNRHLM